MLEQYRERAQQIHQAYKQEADDWRKSLDHTPEAKAKFIALAEEKRRRAVEQLQAEAQAAIETALRAAEARLRQEAEKRLAERRNLLGDTVLADMYRRALETLDAGDIADAYRTAPTEWEKQVISGYGLPLLQTRNRTAPSPELFAAIHLLQQAEPESMRQAAANLRDLNSEAQRLDELDRAQYSSELADRMGIDPALVE